MADEPLPPVGGKVPLPVSSPKDSATPVPPVAPPSEQAPVGIGPSAVVTLSDGALEAAEDDHKAIDDDKHALKDAASLIKDLAKAVRKLQKAVFRFMHHIEKLQHHAERYHEMSWPAAVRELLASPMALVSNNAVAHPDGSHERPLAFRSFDTSSMPAVPGRGQGN